jgi:hypothetical protein
VARLLRLPDWVAVFPGHFEGPCGKGRCGRPSTTIGFERRYNPLARADKDAFVAAVHSDVPARPLNMTAIEATNRGLDAGRHGLLTFRQVRRRHFPDACDQTVHRHLRRLRDAGYLDRRVWGYGAHGEHKAAYLCTARGLRACGLDVPVARDRGSVLASLPHDATVTEVAEAVLAGLAASGVGAAWTTERELKRGVAWLPREWATDAVRPDGVLRVRRPDGREERLAVEVDTTQHNAHQLARRCAAYREALARDVYDGVVWFCAPGATLASVERAVAEYGDGRRMRAAPVPEGAAVYR